MIGWDSVTIDFEVIDSSTAKDSCLMFTAVDTSFVNVVDEVAWIVVVVVSLFTFAFELCSASFVVAAAAAIDR